MVVYMEWDSLMRDIMHPAQNVSLYIKEGEGSLPY
jgi:hypothetical protein